MKKVLPPLQKLIERTEASGFGEEMTAVLLRVSNDFSARFVAVHKEMEKVAHRIAAIMDEVDEEDARDMEPIMAVVEEAKALQAHGRTAFRAD